MSLAKLAGAVAPWFGDRIYRRLLKNASWLTGGTILASLLGLASITIAARALGPSEFGALVLIMAYIAIIDRLLNFQSWQFLIKNGAEALEAGNEDRFLRQIKFSSLLDMVSAVLSTVVAVCGAGIVGEAVGWSTDQISFARLYSLTILFNLIGMPTGVLRLFDKFKLLASQKIVLAVLNFAGVSVAWATAGDLKHFVLAYVLSNIAATLYLLALGWRQLKRQGIVGIWSAPLTDLRATEPGVWRFVFYTNLASSVKIIRSVDVFLIKIILTSEAVGLYAIARKIANSLLKLIDPFFQAVYPEFAKIIAAGETRRLRRLTLQSSVSVGAAASGVWLVFAAIGGWAIPLVFGPSFEPAFQLTCLFMAGIVVWAFAQPLPPILYSLGKAKDAFVIHVATAILYIAALAFLTEKFDLTGAGIAYLGFHLTWTVWMIISVRHHLSHVEWQ